MEIVKGLRDLEQKIEEMGLMETFKKLLLEHERVAIQSGKPIDKRLQNMPDSPAKLADALAFTEPKKRGRKKKIQA